MYICEDEGKNDNTINFFNRVPQGFGHAWFLALTWIYLSMSQFFANGTTGRKNIAHFKSDQNWPKNNRQSFCCFYQDFVQFQDTVG